jgi:hypothetical protein
MKQINIAKPVMDQIVKFEKQRISRWRIVFMSIVSFLLVFFITFCFLIIRQMQMEETFDLLTLFSEDREVINEFWQDTVVSFWNELPLVDIIFGFVVLLCIIALFVFTYRTRYLNHKKLAEINKYRS